MISELLELLDQVPDQSHSDNWWELNLSHNYFTPLVLQGPEKNTKTLIQKFKYRRL